MTRSDAKRFAQEQLLLAMQTAFRAFHDATAGWPNQDKQDAMVALDAQMKRIEKLFGQFPGTWPRGC